MTRTLIHSVVGRHSVVARGLIAIGLAAGALLVGCDGLVEQVNEEQSIVGAYAASDSLAAYFVPAPAYDEQNETPYLPDTAFSLLDGGGSLELSLTANSRNKGTARVELTIGESLYLDDDSTFVLLPDTTISFEGEFITVIDRIILSVPSAVDGDSDADAEETSTPIPLGWLVDPGGTLVGQSQQPVIRPVTRFDTQRGRFVTRDENLGTLYVSASLSKR